MTAATIHDDPSPDEERAIQQGVVAFGDRHAPPRRYRELRLVLRGADGGLLGGLLAALVWDWLQIDVLWVAEAARGRGHGSALLRRAEQPVWRDPESSYVRREVAPAGTGSPVRIVEVDFPAGAEVSFGRTPKRVIDQHVYMLAGEIEIASGGASYRLAAGDCLHMRVGEGNAFRNQSGKPARYAVILTVEGVP